MGFGVVLDDMSDFIAPAQACVLPMQIDARRTAMQIEVEDSDRAPAVAKVTLTDCLACSGCVTSAETVLIGQQSMLEFLSQLRAGRVVIVSISPAARASLAAHYSLTSMQAFAALTLAFGRLGCGHVLDCGLGSDISLLESAAEFVDRFRAAREGGRAGQLPLLSSSCPGWICYAEKVHGVTLLPFISRVKSPQQVMGSLVRALLEGEEQGSAAGGEAGRAYHCAVMPCFDKKLEASRTDFSDKDDPERRDVDCVLSSAEVTAMLREAAIEVRALGLPDSSAPGLPDSSTPGIPDSSLTESVSPGSGIPGSVVPRAGGSVVAQAAAAFQLAQLSNVDVAAGAFRVPPGGAGGYCEFVFRVAALELFGIAIPDEQPLPWTEGRNADLREVRLVVDGEVRLTFATAHGFRNIQNVVRKMKGGKCAYDYVEVMACPGGCLNGGGQVCVKRKID